MKRRVFLLSAAGACGARIAGAAGRVNVAVAGLGARGARLALAFAGLPEVAVTCLVDVDARAVSTVARAIEAQTGRAPRAAASLRHALDGRDIDAVVIATPDYDHAAGTVLACQADKDVYVEPPVSCTPGEGARIAEAARRYRRVVQCGLEARSRESDRRAIGWVRSGRIGRLFLARAWCVEPGAGAPGRRSAAVLDQARWALDVEEPAWVSSPAPGAPAVIFHYPGAELLFEIRPSTPYSPGDGVSVHGAAGVVQIDGRGFQVFDERGLPAHAEPHTPDTHAAGFIECVRSRREPAADLETVGLPTDALCRLGRTVMGTGRGEA